MVSFLISKLYWTLTGFVVLFLLGYILFSSLSTSLDFKIEAMVEQHLAAEEGYDDLVALLAQAQGKEMLGAAGASLGLVEVVLASGYVDIRPQAVSAANSLANNQQ